MPNFLDRDGYINVEEFIRLARDIDRMAAKEGLKPMEIYFSKKAIVKYNHPSRKRLDEAAFTKKRAQPIKRKARMPASGSRVRMMVLLRNYKNLDQYEEFYRDFNAALKAIEQHTRKAEKVIERLKADGAKKRDALNAAFDKNLDCFMDQVLKDEDGDFIDGVDAAVGTSMMGKTLIVKLPNGGYVSVGKADKERFLKAQESAEDDEKPARKKKVARGAKSTRATREERPAKKTRAAKPETRTGKVRSAKATPVKVVKKIRR